MEQDGVLVKGEVLPSKTKNSIVVDISTMKDYEKLNHGSPNTVVHHRNYRVVVGKAVDKLNSKQQENASG